MHQMRNSLAMFCLSAGLSVFTSQAQQLPPGTRSADDQTRESAASQQIGDAESSLEKQDYKGAEVKLKALVAVHLAQAQGGRVQYDLGFAEERNGEDAAAAQAYAASIAALPGFAEPRIALGLLDARAGRNDAAHKELLAAAKLPTAAPYLRARALRGLAHLDQSSQPAAAREELLEALKVTPETPDDVLMGAELAESAGDPADAETAYRRALALTPGNLDATAGLAHVLQQQGKTAEADTLLSAAVKEHPNDPRLIAEAATLYATEGKAAQAIPLIEELRQAKPALAADPATTALLAQLDTVSGNDAEAEKLYATLVVQDPQNPAFLADLGSAQVRQGEYAAAEGSLLKAVAMRSGFHDGKSWAEAAAGLAFAASKNNDFNQTLQAIAARDTVLPNSPSSLFLEATAYDSLHQSKQAVQTYRAFLAIANGKFPDQEFQARHRLVALERMR
jgi:tetratricopeptide (TPR) repeat protein